MTDNPCTICTELGREYSQTHMEDIDSRPALRRLYHHMNICNVYMQYPWNRFSWVPAPDNDLKYWDISDGGEE